MKAYVLSVICAAVLCAIVTDLGEKKGTRAKILKLICGVFLSFTVIRPVAEVKLEEFSFFTADIAQDAFHITDLGQNQSYREMAAIITNEVSAYILDKASDFPGDLTVDVELDENLIPCRVILTGSISSDVKHQLEAMIETDLGIRKEDQIWNE